MRLVELFDKKVDWKWVNMNDVGAQAVIPFDGYQIHVTIEEDDAEDFIAGLKRHNQPIPKWLQMLAENYEQQIHNVVFYHNANGRNPDKPTTSGYEVTGTGNAYAVFSTVIDVMNEYSREFNVDWWSFGAKESSRRKMYDRLASRFSGEVFTIADMDGDKMYVVKA